MTTSYPLSKLSKVRLRRNNLVSLTCAMLTIGTALITSHIWIGLATLYFLAKLYYRTRLLIIADPHLVVSHEGLTIHWSKETFIPWKAIEEVVDASKHVIAVTYHDEGQGKPRVEKIYKWRIEADPQVLITDLKARAYAAQRQNPATLP